MKQERPISKIVDEINESLKKITFQDGNYPTVEIIAEKLGINKVTLYRWLEDDKEFSNALVKLKEVQEKDPFRTGTSEDSQVNALMITLLLLETIDRNYNSDHV